METVTLAFGAIAPPESDCIRIVKRADGAYELDTSALTEEESIAIIDGGPYDSAETAEAAGIAWASEQGVARLYIETA